MALGMVVSVLVLFAFYLSKLAGLKRTRWNSPGKAFFLLL
jgi:O-antigen/teichoic acid export membrane protein